MSWLENGANDICLPPTFLAGLSRGKEKIFETEHFEGVGKSERENRLLAFGNPWPFNILIMEALRLLGV